MLQYGKRIRQARKWAGLTQAKLAESCKVHKNTISDIERGRNVPGLLLGCTIAQALGVNIRWTVGMTPNHRPGVQFDTDQEYVNLEAYRAMNPAEKAQLVEFMSDFHQARKITTRRLREESS